MLPSPAHPKCSWRAHVLHLLGLLRTGAPAATHPCEDVLQIGHAGAIGQAIMLTDLLAEVHAEAQLYEHQEPEEDPREAFDASENEDRGPEGDQCEPLIAHGGRPADAEAADRADGQLWVALGHGKKPML